MSSSSSTPQQNITSQRSDLCTQCTILFSTQGFKHLESPRGWKHSRLSTFPKQHDCPFCHYIWEGTVLGHSLRKRPLDCLRDYVAPDAAGGKLKIPRDELWVVISAEDSSNGIDATNRAKLWVCVKTEGWRMLWMAYLPLLLVVAEGSPFASLTPYRPLTWNGLTPDSEASLKGLLETCQTSHPRCQPSGPRPLPTRLLHLQPGPKPGSLKVQLKVFPNNKMVGEKGHYAALSYCWGGPQAVQLTGSNLPDFQQNIDCDSLPQTLQDAIKVTHALGLSLLWVDALCIIQDDLDDKGREIGNMCAIYENSAVTIAACSARSVNEGFLHSFNPTTTIFKSRPPAPSFSVPIRLDGGHATRSTTTSSSSSSNGPQQQECRVTLQPVYIPRYGNLPLDERGWTFQEALLPPRLLLFGDVEPVLRCRTVDVASAAAGKSFVQYGYLNMNPQRLVNSIAAAGNQQSSMEDGLEGVWKQIVEQFTLRQLSFQEDRPRAISGVVDLLASSYRDECRFGVWLSCSLACLLWKVSPGRDSVPIPGLPSWSWMSVTGRADLDALEWLGKAQAVVEWDDKVIDPTHKRIYLTCRVLTEEEALPIMMESWPDLISESGEETKPQGGGVKQRDVCYLILGRETGNQTLALAVDDQGGFAYRRCGLVELRTRSEWVLKPLTRVMLE